MKTHTFFSAIALLVVVAGTFAITRSALAQNKPDIVTMVANAKTAADHQAIAQYYEQEEEKAKKEAETHRNLLERYKWFEVQGSAISKNMEHHCEELAKHYESLAEDYAALAAAHRVQAKEAH